MDIEIKLIKHKTFFKNSANAKSKILGGFLSQGGPTFAGTPELQSILIKLNNTKFEKKFQNFLHLRNLTWDPFPLNFDTGPNQP